MLAKNMNLSASDSLTVGDLDFDGELVVDGRLTRGTTILFAGLKLNDDSDNPIFEFPDRFKI